MEGLEAKFPAATEHRGQEHKESVPQGQQTHHLDFAVICTNGTKKRAPDGQGAAALLPWGCQSLAVMLVRLCSVEREQAFRHLSFPKPSQENKRFLRGFQTEEEKSEKSKYLKYLEQVTDVNAAQLGMGGLPLLRQHQLTQGTVPSPVAASTLDPGWFRHTSPANPVVVWATWMVAGLSRRNVSTS